LKAGATGIIVGYGTSGPDEQGPGGVKRAVEAKINRVSDGTVDVGGREAGGCYGDSGGPIYMQLSDGANDYGLRVFGSTSGPGIAGCDCTCTTLYVDIAMHVKAIEETEKIDVTPCTDASGQWAPGPECNALQTQGMMGSGTFPDCSVMRTSAPINSCMAASSAAAGSGGVADRGGAGAGSAIGAAGMSAPAAGSSAAAQAGAGASPAAGRADAAAGSGVVAATPIAGRPATPGMSVTGVMAAAGGARSTSLGTGTNALGAGVAGGPGSPQPVAKASPSESGCGVASSARRDGSLSTFVLLALGLLARRRHAVSASTIRES
jgi:hypothetical protein